MNYDIDYYSILNLPETASTNEIKDARKKLLVKYHPDRCSIPDAESMYKKVNEAGDILLDPQTRKLYDSIRNSFSSKKIAFKMNMSSFLYHTLRRIQDEYGVIISDEEVLNSFQEGIKFIKNIFERKVKNKKFNIFGMNINIDNNTFSKIIDTLSNEKLER